jgi:hypothetical protein
MSSNFKLLVATFLYISNLTIYLFKSLFEFKVLLIVWSYKISLTRLGTKTGSLEHLLM